MGIVQSLSVLALRQVAVGACRAVGVIGIEAAGEFLHGRFTDNSRRLAQSLQGSTTKAWQALEIALAGESLWNKLDDADDRAFRLQLRAFLDNAPLEDLPARDADFRAQCLRELRGARKSGLLLGGTLEPGDLARQAANLASFAGSAGLVEREWQALDDTANLLREARYNQLAQFVALRPGGGQLPLIALAVRYFFRRAVEQDAELHRGLSFAQWEALAEDQQRGFAQLNEALDSQGQRLDTLLDLLGEVREAVLDLRQEIAGQRDQIRQLAHDVMDVLGQRQLDKRELRGGDSLSIRNDDERRLVKELVARYRALPTEQRHELPALLNAVGKMEVVAGNFDSARRDFEELVQIVPDERGRAEAFFNAYQAGLECRRWDEALTTYKQAAALDPARFSLFPPSKYEPERILGAGGFGVAILCKDRHTGGRVVVKAIRADGLDRAVTEVFAEARALEELSDDSIIRLRHCDYAGNGNTRPYLVMDYFESVTLAEQIAQRGPLAQDEAVVLLARVARALQKAHDRGICHRDVKPANILVARGGVKLIDFGLALRQQMVTTTLGAAASYTQTLIGSSIAGTIDYAAPEQLGKRPGDRVGPHSDVYGLGKTACFALFGTTMPLARHWRAVPADLADLLGQCLADDPKERPGSCREVADRLMGAVPAPVAQPVPVAQAVPITPTEETPPKPPDPIPHLIVGGLFGAVSGLFAGVQSNWFPDGTTAAVLTVFMTLTVGLAATIGRRQQNPARTPVIPGLIGAAIGLSIPLIYSIHGLLWTRATHHELQSLSPISLLNMAFMLSLAWGVGYGWGRVFGQTAAVMTAVALIALCGVKSETAGFAFGGLLIGGIAAFVFEVATPFRTIDRVLNSVFLAILDPFARAIYFGRERPVAAGPVPIVKPRVVAAASPASESTPPNVSSPVALAIRLPLLVLACAAVGLGAGTNCGAAWIDTDNNDRFTMMVVLISVCGICGTLAMLFCRVEGILRTLLWMFGGGTAIVALAALVGGFGWYWVDSPLSMMVGLVVWFSVAGTLAGTRMGHPALGLLGGLGIAGLCVGGGWMLGHPDPAGLLGIAAGLLTGTLLWSGLSARWLLTAHGLALAVFAAVASLVTVFQPEVGWSSRPFDFPQGKKYGTVGGGWEEKRDDRGNRVQPSSALEFSADSARLLTRQENIVKLWDVSTGRARDSHDFQMSVKLGDSRAIPLVAMGFVLGDPRRLALEYKEEKGKPAIPSFVVHSIGSGTVLGSADLSPMAAPTNLIGATGGGQFLAVVGNGEELTLVRFADNGVALAPQKLKVKGTITAAAVSGERVLLGFMDGTIRLAVPGMGFDYKIVNETTRFGSPVAQLRFSPSGHLAYAVSDSRPDREVYYNPPVGGTVVTWNVEEWKDFFTVAAAMPRPFAAGPSLTAQMAGPYGYGTGAARPTCAAFSQDSTLLLVGTDRGTVQVWDIASQKAVRSYKIASSFLIPRTRALRGIAVSADGTEVGALSDSGRVLLTRVRELEGP